MTVWTWIAAALCITILIVFMVYRRQVKKTCRHLAFQKENTTNLRLYSGLPFQELNELADAVNDLLDDSDRLKRTVCTHEKDLKAAITNISHDIRTPLTSLDGYFQLLAKAEDEEEREKYIRIIGNRIQSLKSMLEELFTFTKLQNDEYSFPLERLNFKKCFCDTLFSFYNDFREKEIEPAAIICEEEIFILGNQEALSRIIQNLIKNVLEHGRREVRISLNRLEKEAVLICENQVEEGEEIDVDKVFVQFYKADTARSHASAGLGLAIAKGLTERMRGELSAGLEDGWFRLTARFPLHKKTSFLELRTR